MLVHVYGIIMNDGVVSIDHFQDVVDGLNYTKNGLYTC